MRVAALLVAALAPLAAQPDIRTVVERSLETADRNWRAARNYTFVERSETRSLDGAGKLKERKVKTFDITLLEGTPYRRLIARDDRPLSPADERAEQEKLRHSNEERKRETGAQRKKRIADFEARRKREFDLMREVPEAFDFQFAGEAEVRGEQTWVYNAKPRPGYRGRTRQSRLFPKFQGRIWVSRRDYAWVKVEAEVVDDIWFGLFLARLAKGSRLVFEQQRVNAEVWLPVRIAVAASARVALLKKINIEMENTYRDYRKFSSESRIISTQPVE